MKTVTIPTSQSPFVVMVNGAKYVYPAGSVQDVPDEVAVVIEAHNKQTAKPNEPVEAPFDCDCGGGGGAQSDWNQTDSSAADFIKNKPFGDMEGEIVPEQTFAPNAEGATLEFTMEPQVGTEVTIIFDGVSHVCAVNNLMGMAVAAGNDGLMMGETEGLPFLVVWMNGMCIVMTVDQSTNHAIKILGTEIVKLPLKYNSPLTRYFIKSDNSDSYIYKDVLLTTKVTRDELIETAQSTCLYLELKNPQQPTERVGILCSSSISFFTGANRSGIVYCTDNDGTIKAFYTSEYTA